jgi:AcrR family transcriptional regulator
MAPKIVDKEERRGVIARAAFGVFVDKGFDALSIADVANAAGIGKGTVYEYFQSKDDLFFAVFEWYVYKTSNRLKINISALGGSATQRLEALNTAVINLWDEISDIFALTMEFWSASSASTHRNRIKAAFKDLYRNLRAIVSSLIQDGIGRGEFNSDVDVEAVAAALVGTWDALFLQAWFDSEFQPLHTAHQFFKVVIRGLK